MPDRTVAAVPAVPNYGIDSDRVLSRDSFVDALRRRWDGRYAVDEFGGDPHLQDVLLVPILGRIPLVVEHGDRLLRTGPALLVANRGPSLVEALVLAGAVQRETCRRLRLVGVPSPPLVGTLTHKLGGLGWRADDVAAVLRAGHLAAAPLHTRWRGAGEAPRGLIAATLGFPLFPVAVRAGGPAGLPIRPWVVSVGEMLTPPEGAEPGDPLVAAELAEAVRAAIGEMLAR